jgi:hypothetical protein
VDGRLTDYFEWLHAARIRAVEGVLPSASHLVMEVYFGTDGTFLFLRLDPDDPPASGSLGGGVLRLEFPGFPDRGIAAPIPPGGVRETGKVRIAAERVLEAAVPLESFPGGKDEYRFQVVVEAADGTLQRIPPAGSLLLAPEAGKATDDLDWYV